jgi:hypothetical protein
VVPKGPAPPMSSHNGQTLLFYGFLNISEIIRKVCCTIALKDAIWSEGIYKSKLISNHLE